MVGNFLWQNETAGPIYTGSWLPDPASGIVMVTGSQLDNTTTGFTAPSSGCVFDAASFGGEPLDGGSDTSPIDQNNAWGHCYFSAGSQPQFISTQSYGSETPSNWGGNLVSIFSSGIGIKNWTWAEHVTSGTTLTLTVPSTTIHNLGAVACQTYGTTIRTFSHVCFDGTTCAAGNAFTAVPSATSAGVGGTRGSTAVLALLDMPAGKTTLTVTMSSSTSDIECAYVEGQKASGSWAIDNSGSGANTNAGTASSSVATGPAVTTSGGASGSLCMAAIAPNNGADLAPASGNEYTYGNIIWNDDTKSGPAAVALLTTVDGSHSPAWHLNNATSPFSASQACFK